jgi:hypothetical protein
MRDIRDRRPDRLGDLAVRFGPKLTAGDADLVEDADILVRMRAGHARFGHQDLPGIHAQQAFDHRAAVGA